MTAVPNPTAVRLPSWLVAEEVHKDQGALVRLLTAAHHAGNGDGVAALDRPQELEVDGPGVVEDFGAEKAPEALGGEGDGHAARGYGIGGAQPLARQFRVVVDILAVQDAARLGNGRWSLGSHAW